MSEETMSEDPFGYGIEYDDTPDTFRVLRLADKHYVAREIPTRDEAVALAIADREAGTP